MNNIFEGIYPAVLTPFRDERSLDLDAFAALVDRLYAAGVDGIYVGGNTGEWYLQTLDERKRTARAAVELSRGRGRVILHVGCARTEDAMELARFAESAGVDAVSSLPPYVQRWNLDEVLEYYRALASSTGLPAMVYYFPALTGAIPGADFFGRVRAIPGIRGFKFTDMNLYELGLMAEQAGSEFFILNGHDQLLLPGLLMGASGGVGSFYNIVPEWFVSLFQAWNCGDLDLARQRQFQINRLIQSVKKHRLIPALKCIAGMQGIDAGICRRPTLDLPPAEREQLLDQVRELIAVKV